MRAITSLFVLAIVCALGLSRAVAAPATQPAAITGQCHCGHVKYEVTGPILKSSYCDCRGCQRASGTLKVPFVTVRRDAIKVTGGTPVDFRAAAGEKCDAGGVWQHCPKCNSPLFWKGHKGNELDIFAGTLDNRSLFAPKE